MANDNSKGQEAASESKPPGKKPTSDADANRWNKNQILVSAIIPLTTFIVGLWATHALQEDQKRRAYVELLSRREESDSNLRKDMFSKVIDQFIGGAEGGLTKDLDSRILSLELLTSNFHESIDLGPLMKQVYREAFTNATAADKDTKRPDRLGTDIPATEESALRRKRLYRMATEIASRELDALGPSGCVVTEDISWAKLQEEGRTLPLIGFDDPRWRKCGGKPGLAPRVFALDVSPAFAETDVSRQAMLRVSVRARRNKDVSSGEESRSFMVTPFDFPMVDNTRLEDTSRVAVVMTRVSYATPKDSSIKDLAIEGVQLNLVYFPAHRTSLRDRPFYDEVLQTLEQEPRKQ